MGVEAGKNLYLTLDDSGSTERDLTAYVTKITLSLKGKGLVDVTAGGDSGHTWASDELEDGSFSVDFLWDPASNVVHDVLTSLRTVTAAGDFVIGPKGSTAGYPKISGTCWLEDLPMDVTVGDVVRCTGVPFKIDGAVTIGTF